MSSLRVNMRGIALMCLLHAAFLHASFPGHSWNGPVTPTPTRQPDTTTRLSAAAKYAWGGPGDTETNPSPSAGSECVTDQGSCGCCLMQQEMNRLRTYFNTSLNKLEKEYIQTNQSLNKYLASHTAVSVALQNGGNFMCFGPFNTDAVVKYNHVFLNLGNGYSPDTGIFTVPHSGVYSLALTVYSDAGAPGNKLAACASLQVNGQVVAEISDNNKDDQEDSATIVMAIHLKVGDRLNVNLPAGCFLCDDNSYFNTFSAFLLYLTE